MSGATPGEPMSLDTQQAPAIPSRPGDCVGTRITEQDVRKASFQIGRTPAQKPPHSKKQQQRYGIRLSKRSKGKDLKSAQWLVPPHLMAAKLTTVDTADGKGEVRHIVKDSTIEWPRKRLRREDMSSSSSSDSSDSDSSDSSDSSSSSSDESSDSSESCKSSGQRICQTIIHVQQKQSGVIGVNWHNLGRGAWAAVYMENGKREVKRFAISKYKTADNSWEYADAKALKEAIKYRQKKAKEGVNVMNRCGRRASRVSGVKGVTWQSYPTPMWRVRVVVKGKSTSVGSFAPLNDTEDAVEEARLAAVEARQRAEAKYYQIHLRQAVRKGGA